MLGDQQNFTGFTLIPTQQAFAFVCECNRFELLTARTLFQPASPLWLSKWRYAIALGRTAKCFVDHSRYCNTATNGFREDRKALAYGDGSHRAAPDVARERRKLSKIAGDQKFAKSGNRRVIIYRRIRALTLATARRSAAGLAVQRDEPTSNNIVCSRTLLPTSFRQLQPSDWFFHEMVNTTFDVISDVTFSGDLGFDRIAYTTPSTAISPKRAASPFLTYWAFQIGFPDRSSCVQAQR